MGRRQRAGDGRRHLIESSHEEEDASAAECPAQDPPTPGFVYVLAFFSALGGFLFGYDTGVVSGAMLLLKKEMNLGTLWQELLVSSTVGAAAVSSMMGGPLNGWLGRKVCILTASFIFSLGGVLLGVAPDKEVLLVGRIIVGLGIGIASMTVPVYIAEVSPPHLRGQLVTINVLFITGGQFIASLMDGGFSYLSHDGWRYMLGLSVVPAAIQFMGFLFLPESPRWLLQKGRKQEAHQVISRIRGGRNVEEEYDAIRKSIEEEESNDDKGFVIMKMLRYGPTRRALFVGCGLQMFQQLSGINTVMYYSATILQMAGIRSDKQAIWLAALTSGTNFVFSLVGVWLVDRVGRRKLTIGSLVGTGLSLALLGVGFLFSALNAPPVMVHPVESQNSTCAQYRSCDLCMLDPGCGFCFRDNSTGVYDSSCLPVDQLTTDRAAVGSCSNKTDVAGGPIWAYNYCPTSYSWVILMGLILYLAFFATGMGPMPWTVNSEIYPLWARSTGNACSATVNWTFNVLVSLTFLNIAEVLTYYGAFFLYTGLVVFGLVFVIGCLPETKGLQLEEIENLFTGRLCSCGASSQGHQVQYIRHGLDLTQSNDKGVVNLEGSVSYITLKD